jgi:hypothetical protein
MGKGCSLQPYCISTIHGGHCGSWAAMTEFWGFVVIPASEPGSIEPYLQDILMPDSK